MKKDNQQTQGDDRYTDKDCRAGIIKECFKKQLQIQLKQVEHQERKIIHKEEPNGNFESEKKNNHI